VRVRTAILTGALLDWTAPLAFACFFGSPHPGQLVSVAEVIVRVRAVEEIRKPGASALEPGLVRFLMLEQLKGEAHLFDLSVPGTLTDRDDFNDRPLPYDMVRRDGRGGGCYAMHYRREGEFLLLLRQSPGGLTPYWAALAPTTEQVRGAGDPWVTWVRQQIAVVPEALSPLPLSRRNCRSQSLASPLIRRGSGAPCGLVVARF
jgi:hypothetical protein